MTDWHEEFTIQAAALMWVKLDHLEAVGVNEDSLKAMVAAYHIACYASGHTHQGVIDYIEDIRKA